MADTLFPDVVDYPSCHQQVHLILDNLISRGNRVAEARRSELCHLETLCQDLTSRVQLQGHQMLHLTALEGMAADFARRMNEEQQPPPQQQEHQDGVPPATADSDANTLVGAPTTNTERPFPPSHAISNMEFLDDVGISSEEFLSIVQEIGDPETLPDSMLTLV